ncbi:Arm DNA-binding domain-containing protein [Mariprofundus ferrooxydans]|uniref:Prophage CP4-like integrase n=1 Tax=Mariprofundus ferrooxydans PV-1 TaxID=314345 RepID=Q0F3U9_9PROT|nr:Arm DNA-binding domain-containing protein [Mariprofundus ferrooxydans]EAU55842.1 prophage CP4-like integrase [Mariprofundus ferrooxydans PV-1]KON46618.1 integrase [Mariprofundus ferrooxydans]
MALSDEQVNEASIPEGKKQLKISDGGGLYLLVKPSGRYWKLAYRFDGKQKSLALGVYPAVSLDDARQKREQAKSLLADGVDPGVVKQQQKRRAVATETVTTQTSVESPEPEPVHATGQLELALHQQPVATLSREDQARIEDRRLRILQLLVKENAYTVNEQLLQQSLDALGHKVSSDRLRTDLAWLYEQQVLLLETDGLWIALLTRNGLEVAEGRMWIPGIKRPEPLA